MNFNLHHVHRTNTECEFKSKPIKRQVCTHKYLQKQHNVPATNVEVNPDSGNQIMVLLIYPPLLSGHI